MRGPSDVYAGTDGGHLFMLQYSFASTKVRVETEVWAFSTISFIAEMGGSLGLFVGFSFLSVWDWLAFLVEKYKNLALA